VSAKKDNLPLPYGVTRADLESVDVQKLKDAMVKGVYLVELLLFSQAEFEAQKLGSLRGVKEVLFDSLYDPERMSKTAQDGGYALDTKMDLLKLAHDMHKDGLKFLGDLHRNVATGMEAVKSVEKAAAQDKVPLEQKPSRKRAVKEARRLLEDEMARRVKEIEAKAPVVRQK
jgi:hypothetical protein